MKRVTKVSFEREDWSRLWQYWLVMLLMGLVMIAVEVIDHQRMYIEHESPTPLWQDWELIREIIILGIAVPVSGGLALTFLERTSRERDEAARELDERRRRVQEINNVSGWPHLVEYLVQLPGAVTPAVSSSLLLQEPGAGELTIAARWTRPGFDLPTAMLAECRQCLADGIPQLMPELRCRQDRTGDVDSVMAHCLPLSAESPAILRFYLPTGQPMTDFQERLLADLAMELSLALQNLWLVRSKVDQAAAADQVRIRIGRNLHDTLAQNISYLRFKLEQLSAGGTVADYLEIQKEIEKMRDVAAESYDQVRDALADLRPGSETNLVTALRQQAEEIGARAGFGVNLQVENQPRPLPPRVCRNVLYIVREALNNVEKHAQAEQVEISLRWLEEEMQLTIGDDGIGLHNHPSVDDEHYGLAIMQERAESIGGRLAVRARERGTEVELRL